MVTIVCKQRIRSGICFCPNEEFSDYEAFGLSARNISEYADFRSPLPRVAHGSPFLYHPAFFRPPPSNLITHRTAVEACRLPSSP